MARHLLTIAIFLSLPWATVALAQRPSVEIKIDLQTLEVGEAVNLQFVCTNTGRPGAPEAVVPDGLKLKMLGAMPASRSFTQIINGRRTQESTFTYSMQLTASKEGTYLLGPITVVADGQTYQAGPVQITVKNTQTASDPDGDRFIFVEMEVEPKSLYVTESFLATLTIGIRKVEIGGRIYDLDLLRQVLDGRSSQLSIFANGTAKKSRRVLADSTGKRHRYEIFRVDQTIRAEQVGSIQVGPIFLKANYPTAIRRGFFGGHDVVRARKETARVNAIAVEVKGPPQQGRPDGFAGAIGRFTIKVSAKPTHIEKGQPVTLAISIGGVPLEGIAGPDLTRQPELASRFDYTNDELVGDIEGGKKVFRRAIFPKQIGEQTIPPISWSYFDPREERYRTLTSDPIAITVDPSSTAPTSITIPIGPNGEPEGTTLTVLTGGISPNFIDAETVLADHSFTLTLPWLAALVLSPALWLIATVTGRHRARLRGDEQFARRKRAKKRAHARIRQALGSGDPFEQMHGMADALTGYLSDRYCQTPGTLTSNEVRSLLADHEVEDATAGQIVFFLEADDLVRYAPSASRMRPAVEVAKDIRGWIKQIERGR